MVVLLSLRRHPAAPGEAARWQGIVVVLLPITVTVEAESLDKVTTEGLARESLRQMLEVMAQAAEVLHRRAATALCNPKAVMVATAKSGLLVLVIITLAAEGAVLGMVPQEAEVLAEEQMA